MLIENLGDTHKNETNSSQVKFEYFYQGNCAGTIYSTDSGKAYVIGHYNTGNKTLKTVF